MLLKLAAASTVVALSVTPCFGQSRITANVEPNPFSLAGTVRRAWEADAKGLLELAAAEHTRGVARCYRKDNVSERVECFQLLIERHFRRQVITDPGLHSWCADDADVGQCLESLAAQEVERWLYKRTASTAAHTEVTQDRNR